MTKSFVKLLKRCAGVHPAAAGKLVNAAGFAVRLLINISARLGSADEIVSRLWEFNLKYMYVANDISRVRNERGESISHEHYRRFIDTYKGSLPVQKREKPRLVLYIGSLNAGGAERQLCNLATGLPVEVMDILVLTSTRLTGAHAHYKGMLDCADINVVYAGDAGSIAAKRCILSHFALLKLLHSMPNLLNTAAAELLPVLMDEPPDILHAWLDQTNLCAGIAGLLAGVPFIILSTRNVNPNRFPYLANPLYKPWYQYLLSSGGVALINNSHAGAADYAKWLGYPLAEINVVLNGVDFDSVTRAEHEECRAFRESYSIGENDRLIAGVFRLSDEKQPMMFVEACLTLMDDRPDLHVIVAGVGPRGREMQDAVAGSAHGDRFLFIGRYNNIPLLLSAADILLHTSRFEGTPNAVLEAQWLGCPVVATRAGGTIDAVNDGVSGLLLDVDDRKGLEAAVRQLLDDEETRKCFGLAGPEFIASKFSRDRMVQETLDIYRSSLSVQGKTIMGGS